MYVSGMLRQNIKASGIKIKKNDERCKQFKQNSLFRTKRKLFYETLDGKKPGEAVLLDPQKQPLSGARSGLRKSVTRCGDKHNRGARR